MLIKNIPKKVVTIRPSDKPFMTSAIRRKMRQRNRVHYKAKLKNNDYQWDKYQHIRNEVLSMVRKSKQNYKEKFTLHILNKAIPPGEWLRIFNQ